MLKIFFCLLTTFVLKLNANAMFLLANRSEYSHISINALPVRVDGFSETSWKLQTAVLMHKGSKK